MGLCEQAAFKNAIAIFFGIRQDGQQFSSGINKINKWRECLGMLDRGPLS